MDNRMKMIMATVLVATVIAGALFMSGCVGPTEEEVTKVTVMMPFVPLPLWSAFYCATDQGYYADEGLNVTITYTTYGTMDSLKQLAANNVDFGYGGDEGVIIARSQGMPVVAIHKTVQHGLYNIVSKHERNITKPEDLVGKKIASPSTGATITILTKAMLYEVGLDPDSVDFVFVGGGLIPSLIQDKVDAMGGYVPQKVIIQRMGYNLSIINDSDYTPLGKTYIFTSERMIKENPEIVKKFVCATQRGLEYAIDNPDEATDIYIKFNPEAAGDKELNLAIWKTLIMEDTGGSSSKEVFGLPSEDDWTAKQDTLYAIDVIDKKTDVNELYTDEFAKWALN